MKPKIFVGLMALSLLLTPLRARAADAVTLILDWTPGGFAASWYYGVENGCFPAQNIALTVSRGYGGADTVTKIAAGTGTFGTADLSSIMLGKLTAGAAVKAVMPMYSASPIAVAVLDNSGISRLTDLQGKTIAAAPGDSGIKILPIAIDEAGGDFSKVKVETVDFATLTGLLVQGKVDAITTYTTTAMLIDQAARKAGKSIKTLNFARDMGLYSNSVLASETLIAQNPDLVKRFKVAAACAFEKARDNIPAAAAAMNKALGGMDEGLHAAIMQATMPLIFDNPIYKANGFSWNKDALARTLDVALRAQGLTMKADPLSFVAAN